MTQFLLKLKLWLAKLAFWRKRTVEADPKPELEATQAADVADPASEAPAAKPGWVTRLKEWLAFRRRKIKVVVTEIETGDAAPAKSQAPSEAAPEPEDHAPKPSFLARLKQWLTFRRKPTVPEAETGADAPAAEAAHVPAPKPSFIARLKRMLSFRRKAVEVEVEADSDDKTLVIEKAKAGAGSTTSDVAEAAPPPGKLKQFLIRLRNKWVWIPALSLAVVGSLSWVLLLMMQATHEKARLQTELNAAKKMLEQKQAAAVARPAPPPKPAPPAKPEKKIDPAFDIVGHIPEPQFEAGAGINAEDCIVKDKASVAENLKHCITSFNEAVADATNKPQKKP